MVHETFAKTTWCGDFAATSGWFSHFNVRNIIRYKSICGEYIYC